MSINVAIIGKQQPRYIRENMKESIIRAGYKAELLDMETRNTADFKEQLKPFSAIISAGEKFPAETFDYLEGNLELVSRFGVGTDEMDHSAATKNGIAICNAAGSFAECVAECALGLMINLLRNFPQGDTEVRRGDWSRFFEGKNGRQLRGKTIGLIGFGDISRALARMLKGFNCTVIAYDTRWDEQAAKELNVTFTDIETIKRTADVISLHIPSTPQTNGMINTQFLKDMKHDAVLINTSRGKLVVESDLAEALNNGIIAAAGTDVFSKEPPDNDNPILKAKNTMLLPHSGSGGIESVEYAGMFAAQNVIDFFTGKTVSTILNPDYKNYSKKR